MLRVALPVDLYLEIHNTKGAATFAIGKTTTSDGEVLKDAGQIILDIQPALL